MIDAWPTVAHPARAALLGLAVGCALSGCTAAAGAGTPTPTRAAHLAAGDREVCVATTASAPDCFVISSRQTICSTPRPVRTQQCHWEAAP